MGFPWEWEWELVTKIGNVNGKEWETACMGMGMAIIPMGIDCTGMGGSGNVKSHSRASLIYSIGNLQQTETQIRT